MGSGQNFAAAGERTSSCVVETENHLIHGSLCKKWAYRGCGGGGGG